MDPVTPPAAPPATPPAAPATPPTPATPDPVPYARFKEVNEEKNRLNDELKKLQDAEEARKKAAMSEQERIKAELDEQKKLSADLKAKADKADAYEKARKDALKTQLGDKWEPEFETMELTLLEKVSGKLIATVPNPTKPDKPGDSQKPKVSGMPEKEFKDLERRVRSGEKVELG